MTMGRPKLPPHRRLSEVVRFRVTVTEADILYQNAIRERKSLPEYLREKLAGVIECLST